MRKVLGFSSAMASAVVVALIACGGSSTTLSGPGPGSALCGISGTNQCASPQQCDAKLGCVDCTSNAGCSGMTPFCATGLGQCVVCLTNAQCPASAPACWPGDHQCHAACTGAGSCPNRAPICDTAAGAGFCVGCLTAADCSGTSKICSATVQQCVDCASNTDCPSTRPRCFAGAGQCVQCLGNTDCGAAQPICDPQDFTCRAGCTSAAQCAGTATPICDTSSSSCVQCLSSTDCAAQPDKFCGKGGRCVACVQNSNCPLPTASICRAGVCGPCTRSKDCASGQSCVNGACQ